LITFTQFVRPFGRPRENSILRPGPIEVMAIELHEAGFRFEMEELQTGEVSFEIVHRDDQDHERATMRICPNGPQVPATVDDLITAAHQRWKDGVCG